jgi:mono/diheme cytochrome c family protein
MVTRSTSLISATKCQRLLDRPKIRDYAGLRTGFLIGPNRPGAQGDWLQVTDCGAPQADDCSNVQAREGASEKGNCMRRITLFVLLLFVIGSLAVAQEVKRVPAKYTNPGSGSEMYKAYCASCHGLDGKGTGPAAVALKANMPDLTQLTKNNHGEFPSDHVSQVIIGDSLVSAHGDKEMPVWGPPFLSMDARDRSVVLLRAKNLTDHIEKLQVK